MFTQTSRFLAPTLVLLLCVLLCVGAPLATLAINDVRLHRFADRFYDYPLPPRTEVLSRRAKGGRAEGANGNHCDFLATQRFLTHLGDAEIREYYRSSGLAQALERSYGGSVFVHIKPQGRGLSDTPRRVDVRFFWLGDSAGLDIRCH